MEVLIEIGKLEEKCDDVFLTSDFCGKVVAGVVGEVPTF